MLEAGPSHRKSVIWLLLFVAVQSLSRVLLFVTPWIAAHQACLSFTITFPGKLTSCPAAPLPEQKENSYCCSWLIWLPFSNLFTSVAQSCLSLRDPMDGSMPGFPVPHKLPELAQTQVHWVHDAMQPSHPLSSHSPPAFNLSQHQGLSQWISSSHQVAKVLEFQLQHQSFKWIFRTPFL